MQLEIRNATKSPESFTFFQGSENLLLEWDRVCTLLFSCGPVKPYSYPVKPK